MLYANSCAKGEIGFNWTQWSSQSFFIIVLFVIEQELTDSVHLKRFDFHGNN